MRGPPDILGIDKGMGPLEAKVLRLVCDVPGPVTVREVCDALAKDGYFAYQGVLNCLNRLVRKGILSRSKRRGTLMFSPRIRLEELVAQVVGKVLEHMPGDPDRVICRVFEIDPDIGAEEIAKLRKRVRGLAGKKR